MVQVRRSFARYSDKLDYATITCTQLHGVLGRSDNAIKNRWHLLQRLSRRQSKQQRASEADITIAERYMKKQQIKGSSIASLPIVQSVHQIDKPCLQRSSISMEFMSDDDIITVTSAVLYQLYNTLLRPHLI